VVQASRVVIFQAPMASQPPIQPTMTAVTAHGGHGRNHEANAAGRTDMGASREHRRLQLVHRDPDDEPLLAPAVTRRLIEDFCSGPAPGSRAADGAARLSERELGVVRPGHRGEINR
jgi:hypothetical protein